MDKYVPNPSKLRPLHVDMFCFVGKLMGIAMRSGAALPFHFPPLFYRRILGLPVREKKKRRLQEIQMLRSEQRGRA